MADIDNPLRALPQLQRLLETEEAEDLVGMHGHAAVTIALRGALERARSALLSGKAVGAPPRVTLLAEAARSLDRYGLRRVINATGIIVHTNLGRAPLAEAARDAMLIAAGACDLEWNAESGRRGARGAKAEALLCELTGAEAALVVNNCAAAVLLALTATAAGGEVIVSRGELVEIGGGFRVPEVIAQGGARLVEVGTTNCTRARDYAAAITERTRALLKVHPSNFRITGFTEAASLTELSTLARARGLALIEDQGGGCLSRGQTSGPPVSASIAAGADVVAFSGDKLLGGPQAGLLVGTVAAIAPLRAHPLLRALRIDKISLAALEATLGLHRIPTRALDEIPVLRMLAQGRSTLRARAEMLGASLPDALIVETEGFAGGGASPTEVIPSVAVAIGGADVDALARRLRTGVPRVAGRIAGGLLLLDMLAVDDSELTELADAVRGALERD